MQLVEYDLLSSKEKAGYFESLPDSRRKKAKKLICGVGVYDFSKPTLVKFTVGNKKYTRVNPPVNLWKVMLRRCYDATHQNKYPTYKGATVCDSWLVFSNFYNWWRVNYVQGWDLDKDILTSRRVYSPENCIYMPSWLNSFTVARGNGRGKHLLGVCWDNSKGKFKTSCNNMLGQSQHLGYFNSETEAYLAWKTYKLGLALEYKPEMDAVDLRVYPRVVEIINNLT